MFKIYQRKIKEIRSTELFKTYFRYAKTHTKSLSLLDFESILEYVPFTIGYSLKVQKILINITIEKKGKRNLVKDLRMISLIEADFNLNNDLTNLTIECTKRNNLIPGEQYRSKKRNTIYQAMNK